MWLLLFWACSPCRDDHPCSTESGEYFRLKPTGARGETPTLLYFHGYGGTPEPYLDDPEVQAAVDATGVALVLPVGLDRRWTVPRSPEEGLERDDLAFSAEVVDDLRARGLLAAGGLYVGGFSLGASLAEYLACDGRLSVQAAHLMSGTFWDPMPEACAGGPLPVRHTHGSSDQTWPMEGRAFSDTVAQGAIEEAVEMWRAQDACGAATETVTEGPEVCTVWTDCAGGAEVRLCMHGEGHERLDGWLDRSLGWLTEAG
jgi:polyhydroxybutyrate depolymerase